VDCSSLHSNNVAGYCGNWVSSRQPLFSDRHRELTRVSDSCHIWLSAVSYETLFHCRCNGRDRSKKVGQEIAYTLCSLTIRLYQARISTTKY